VDDAIRGAATCLIDYYEHPEYVQQVLAEMCFQMGTYGLSKFGDMLQSIRIRDYVKAAEHGLDSEWFRNKHGGGTPARAKELMTLLAS